MADLWQLGTLGVQSRAPDGGAGGSGGAGDRVRVDAWFPADATGDLAADLVAELEDLDLRWRQRGVETLGSQLVPEADWLALWRRGARPIPVGNHLLLDPREPERGVDDAAREAATAGRHLLQLPARRAFGTGSHETTRLTLLLLEEVCTGGGRSRPQRVLDVGTGTGVLAFAALLLGVPHVVAYDRDPLAVAMARDNARLNGFSTDPSRPEAPLFFTGTAESLHTEFAAGKEGGAVFDLVLINILPHLVAADLPRLVRVVAPGGAVVVAGMLAEEGAGVIEGFAGLGFKPFSERREGAWVAYRFERASS